MNTRIKPKSVPNTAKKIRIRSLHVSRTENPIVEVIEQMRSVDLNSREADLNVTSISDNNGRRIELENTDYIKK